jgi:hypothetical protein
MVVGEAQGFVNHGTQMLGSGSALAFLLLFKDALPVLGNGY